MIERGLFVRFVCLDCREFFDVDLAAIADRRGRAYSLVGMSAQCKRCRCRGHGVFTFAVAFDQPFALLVDQPERLAQAWLTGLRPCDVESLPDGWHPPDDPPLAAAARG